MYIDYINHLAQCLSIIIAVMKKTQTQKRGLPTCRNVVGCEFERSTRFMSHSFIRAFDLCVDEYFSLESGISFRPFSTGISVDFFTEFGQECVK